MTIFLISAIIFLLLIFPIKAFIYSVVDVKKGCFKFEVFVYFIRVFSGGIFIKNNSVYIKNGKNFEKELKINDILTKKGKLKPFSFGYKIKEIIIVSELSSSNFIPLTYTTFLGVFGDEIALFLKNKYQIKLNYFITLKDEIIKRFYIKTAISFSGFSIIISLLKVLINKLRRV